MNIGIYQTVNAHAPAIHWWLANDSRFGPQLYEGKNPCFIGNHIGSLVEEIRGNPDDGGFDHQMDAELYDVHQESLREMENKKSTDRLTVDCTSAYFKFNNTFQYPVWSNYFGATHGHFAPACDKLIFARSTVKHSAMFYITQYAFNKIDSINQVNDHSKIWWEDHMLMSGDNIGRWKEIWYRDYHDQCIADFNSGKLQYMWQLNFAHWDLFDQLQYGNPPFKLDYAFYRLFKNKHDPSDIESQTERIENIVENKIDHLLTDIDWFKNTDVILDYLGVSNSDILKQTAQLYRNRYEKITEVYGALYNKYYVKGEQV
jgi:hypothetical protein